MTEELHAEPEFPPNAVECRRHEALSLALQYFAESEDCDGIIAIAGAFEAYLRDGTDGSEGAEA